MLLVRAKMQDVGEIQTKQFFSCAGHGQASHPVTGTAGQGRPPPVGDEYTGEEHMVCKK